MDARDLRPEDVVPLEGGQGPSLRSVLHAVTTFGVSTAFREDVMRDADFPLAGDLPAFLALNELIYRGVARPAELADALDTGRSNVSKILQRLEHAGLVVRGRDPGDGRSVVVVLTADGRDVGSRILRAVDQSSKLFSTWPERDLAELHRLLLRLATDLDALPRHTLREVTGIRLAGVYDSPV
ncbi:MarR family winged helix-turn-helix transcriptional regulator [Demequina sp.]|uniref:MarR family winged helix-turn-helix transcriptional regulator n=1 Tax=Demequina sp. TaxID=2050685 RepID=UPI0025EF0F8C|nr:MarR family winged helix-turn-helix transcriptional regulator [Demequina sp.]